MCAFKCGVQCKDSSLFSGGYRQGKKIFSSGSGVRGSLAIVVALLSLGLMSGCSGPAKHSSIYPPGYGGTVRWYQGNAIIPGSLSEQIHDDFQRLLQARSDPPSGIDSATGSGAKAELMPLVIVADPSPNAFAVRDKGQQQVHLNAGLIDLIGYDQASMAFVLAHEIGHIELRQLSDEVLNSAKQQDSVVELLGAVADVFLPMSSLLLVAGNEAIKAGYSRDQERNADRYGLWLMRRAGFDPQGAVRFQQQILRLSDSRGLAILSSHPNGEERIANLHRLIEQAASVH